MKRIDILGAPIDVLTMTESVAMAETFIASGRPHQLIAINAAKIVLAHQRPEFRDLLWKSDLNFVDGQPVRFAAQLLGHRLPELISGHFLMERLVATAAEKGYSVYFLGAQHNVTAKVAELISRRYPTLRVAGWRDGYWKQGEDHQVVQEVRETGAQMLFLALGTPRKEQWIYDHKFDLQVPVCMGVGGSFDVIAGVAKVEPAWIRNAGLAWLFRLVQEPGRLWKRYATTNPVFVWLLIRALGQRAVLGLGKR
jgi:N-acetylglucosaminyldiphosphoundecaprenol N-acetyl-beta-D-mannosaminyltransferase